MASSRLAFSRVILLYLVVCSYQRYGRGTGQLAVTENKCLHRELKLLNLSLLDGPNSENIKVEDSQLIFKLRCRMTKLKMNFKGDHETYECRACETEEETQTHVYEQCTNLIDSNIEPNEKPEYRKLFNGTVKDQLKIAKIFRQKMKILEEMDK